MPELERLMLHRLAELDVVVRQAYLEFDYASGEATPGARAALSRFSFADDTNVGLLLFDRVLGYQSARAAAADAAPEELDALALHVIREA